MKIKIFCIFFEIRVEIKENVRKEANIIFNENATFLELDFWLPELRLAFEFQVLKLYNIKYKINIMYKKNFTKV